MRLYETRTTDFTDDEISAIRGRDGQLYADVSTKLAPDDFATDLRKLAPSGECIGCPKRPDCGGAFRAERHDVFTRDAERVETIVRGLRGRILDVGCGEGPYAAAVAASVRAGIAEYCGIDPDAARIALLRSRHPWATYFVGTLEEYVRNEPGAPLASHVLFLRSYNHLPDPSATIDAAVSQLEARGTLLVVDNVAFGLVRSASHAARAERGPGRFEHYRNATAAEAGAVIDRPGLRLLERRDVTPAGSNEWLLHYEKPASAA